MLILFDDEGHVFGYGDRWSKVKQEFTVHVTVTLDVFIGTKQSTYVYIEIVWIFVLSLFIISF